MAHGAPTTPRHDPRLNVGCSTIAIDVSMGGLGGSTQPFATATLPTSGNATFATDRFRLTTAAARMSQTSASPERSGAVEVATLSTPAPGAVLSPVALTRAPRPRRARPRHRSKGPAGPWNTGNPAGSIT